MGASCTKAGREEAAFLKAAKDGDCRVVQQAILRDVEWTCKVQTWNGQSVLHLAARYGRLDVLETVVEAVRFNPAGPDKWTKLLRMGHSTDAILRAFVNLQDARCQTPLHLACIYGHNEVAEQLLQLGGTPWAWDELGGRTPLHYAASMGHVDVIRVIISHNAKAPTGEALRRPNSSRTRLVDICNDSGYTPLHYAVWAGNVASVRALTSYEASLSARNVACGSDWVVSCLKCTPLHLAAHKGNQAMVKLLLSAYVQYQPPHGTDAPSVNDRRRRDPRRHVNANRQLPYHVASSRNHSHLSEMLHPDVPFSFILSPSEMESRLYGVPKLAAIAAKVLQAKLVADIESSLAAMMMMSTAVPRGSAAISSGGGGSVTAGRTRSGAMTALSGAVVAAATGQAGGGGTTAAAATQQVLAAATARLRSANERSLHGSTAAMQALDAARLQTSPSTQQRPASADHMPNGVALVATPASAMAPTVVATPVTTASGGAAATGAFGNGAVTAAAGGKSASASSSDKASATSAGDSEKEALALDPVPDLATRPTPLDDGGAGNPPPALPLPPAPISPFLPSAAATGDGTSAGTGPSVGRVPTFNEAASAFALFAAEPFDDPAGGGGGGGGPALQASGSASVSIAALARGRTHQAAGGSPLSPAGNNSVSIAALARNKAGAGSGNKLAPGRSRSLRSLLTGGGKHRRSNTAVAAGAGAGSAGQRQHSRGELPSPEDLAADGDAAYDLDDILNAMQPPENLNGITVPPPPPSAATTAAGAAATSVEGTAAATTAALLSSARGSATQLQSAPSRGRGASAGSRPFWRRSGTQVPLSPAGDAAPTRPPTPDGGSPYTGSMHASLAASAALAATATTSASTAPPETLPAPVAAAGDRSRAPSLPSALPPGVIESRASTEVSELDVTVATGRRHLPPAAAPSAGITPIYPTDDDSDPARPSSAGTRVRRSSINLAELARGGAEAVLPAPPQDQEHVDGAVLAMLASLVEAPQHVLRRYRLLQLTQGLDLHDLLRDHSEHGTVAAGVGGGVPPRVSGVEGQLLQQPSRSEAPSVALPVPPPALLTSPSSAGAGCPRWPAAGAGSAADSGGEGVAAAAAAAANASVGGASSAADMSSSAPGVPPGGGLTSPFAQDAGLATAPSFGSRLPAPGPAAAAGPTTNAASANLAGQLLRTLSSAAASESGEGTCGVCFDLPDVLSIAGCGHRLCTDCSRELCKLNTLKPALCPFCRGMIGGFKFVGRS